MEFNPTCNNPLWTREEDKAFENSLAIYSDHICPWEKIAVAVPGRTVDEINNQFEVLKPDVSAIESGNIPLPDYAEDRAVRKEKSSTSNAERKRGIPWTKEEHRLFVYGLEKYGKSDWRSISRYYVRTRTPTQVASHAQKFFKRLDNVEKSRKRTSIHDITVLDEGKLLNKKVLITGQPSSEGGGTSRGGTRKKTRTYENFGVAIKLLRSSGAKKVDVSTAQRPSTEETVGASGVGLSAHSLPNLHGISFSENPSTRPMIRAGDGGWISPSIPNCGISFSEDPSIQQMIGASDGGLGTHLMAHLQGVPVPKVPHSRRTIGAANVGLISSHQGVSIPQAPVNGHMFGAADVGFIGYPFPTHQHILNHQAPRSVEIFGATAFCAPIVNIQQNMPTLQWPVPQQMMGDGGADFSDSLIADTEEGFDVGKYLVDFDPSEPDYQEPIASPVLAPGCVPPLG